MQLEKSTTAVKAEAAILRKIHQTFERALACGNKAADLTISGVNALRECGIYLAEMKGNSQFNLSFFISVQKKLPKKMSFDVARGCVGLGHNMPQEVRTYAEAQRAQQLFFQTAGLIEAPHRDNPGSPTARNPTDWIINTFSTARVEFEKLLKTEPMEDWTEERLDTFIAQTQPFYDQHAAARNLRGSRH